MTKRWTATKSYISPKRLASKRARVWKPERMPGDPSWYCNRCQVEVSRLHCQHCGKSETEER